jgi:hypothetical protein
MKILYIEYGNQTWAIEIEKQESDRGQIGLYLFKDVEWVRYGSMTITKDPTSCSMAFERNMMPYVVVRELMKLIDAEVKRIGVTFNDKVFWEES